MSLFTDGAFVTLADLSKIESEIPDVATTEGINADAAISQATQEFIQWATSVSSHILGRNVMSNPAYVPPVTVSQLVTPSTNRPQWTWNQVVTHDPLYGEAAAGIDDGYYWSDLKRLVVYESVVQFYREASSRKDVDRFEEKWLAYRREVRDKYRPRFTKRGLPIVNTPLPCPGARGVPGSRTQTASGLIGWSATMANAGGTLAAPVEVILTWVGANYQGPTAKLQAESGPSASVTTADPGGATGRVTIDISGLQAPNGVTPAAFLSAVMVPTQKATGWNVYARLSGQGAPFVLQNLTPIPVATLTWNLDSLRLTGPWLDGGQYPDYWLTIQTNRFSRG
jgi:hypothetical protein